MATAYLMAGAGAATNKWRQRTRASNAMCTTSDARRPATTATCSTFGTAVAIRPGHGHKQQLCAAGVVSGELHISLPGSDSLIKWADRTVKARLFR